MRFGFMEDFRNPVKWRRPFPELYSAILDQIVRAEELGYDNVWLTEHHFTEDGYNPALMATASAIATRTSTIRIGTFILLLPFLHPARAAEDTVCADIFSNGRIDLGLGQGYSYHEWNAFCMNRSERGSRMREGIDLMTRLFTEDNVTFDGKYTQVKGMTLSPKPVQQPHPPIWIGARGPKAIKRAAQAGFHLMATLGPDPAPLYVETLKESGRNPADFNICQLRMRQPSSPTAVRLKVSGPLAVGLDIPCMERGRLPQMNSPGVLRRPCVLRQPRHGTYVYEGMCMARGLNNAAPQSGLLNRQERRVLGAPSID